MILTQITQFYDFWPKSATRSLKHLQSYPNCVLFHRYGVNTSRPTAVRAFQLSILLHWLALLLKIFKIY